MKQRCFNNKNEYYKNYGARGIIVCDRWIIFTNFYDDMAYAYKDGLSIERIDNDGNYEKDNCIWATNKIQNRNTRRNHLIEYNGEKKLITDWALIYKIPYNTIIYRLYRGWSIEKSLIKPTSKKICPKKIIDTKTNKIYNTVTDAAKSNGLKVTTLSMMLTGINRNKTDLIYYTNN